MTLVEVLLASTVFAMTMTGLSTHLHSSLAVWRRATSSIEALQEANVMLDQMAQDAANMVHWNVDESKTFQPIFEDHRIAFVMVSAGRVGMVTYSLEEQRGSSVLVRRWQTMPEARVAHPGRVTRVLAQVNTFDVRLFPQAVEVTLECHRGAASFQSRRLLVSPGGGLPTPEEVG